MILTFIIQFVVAVFAVIGFAIVFNAPMRELHLCGFTGAFGWLLYYILTCLNVNVVAASLIATFFLTIIARVFAVRRSNPATVYLLPGIFPLVPGAGIYYTAYYLIQKDRLSFGVKGVETLEIAIAIVFGIIFGSAIPQIVFNKLFGKHKKQNK